MKKRSQKSGGGAGGWVPIGDTFIGAVGGHAVPDDGRLFAAWATNDIVYTAVTRNAMAVASVPWRLFRVAKKPKKKGVSAQQAARWRHVQEKAAAPARVQAADALEEVTDHPLLDLLAGPVGDLAQPDGSVPADTLGGWSLWFMTALMLDVFGGAYWRIIPGAMGIPAQVRLLPTQMIRSVRDNSMAVTGYVYTPPLAGKNRIQFQIDAAEIIDFRFPSVEDPWGGRQSPLRSAYGAAQLAVKYNDFQNSLFDNRARIDGTFIPKEVLTPEQSERAENLWNQKFGRTGNGRVRVATQPGTFVPTQYPPQDLGELKISQDALKRVCDAFGLPEALLSKEATYANMQASIHLHAKAAIKPRIELLEAQINRRLVPQYGDDLFLAADNPVPAEAQLELQRTQIAMQAGVLSANEARAALGFDKIEAEWADEFPANKPAAAAAATNSDGVEPPGDAPGAAGGDPTDPAVPAPGTGDAGAGAAAAGETPEKAADWLLMVNRMVSDGSLERCVAINMVQRRLEMDEPTARMMVGHAAKRRGDDSPRPRKALPGVGAAGQAANGSGGPDVPETPQYVDAIRAVLSRQQQWLLRAMTHIYAGEFPSPAPSPAEKEAAVKRATRLPWWDAWGVSADSPMAWLVAWYLLEFYDRANAALAAAMKEQDAAITRRAVAELARQIGVVAKAEAAMLAEAEKQIAAAIAEWAPVINDVTLRRAGAQADLAEKDIENGPLPADEAEKKAPEDAAEVFQDDGDRAEVIGENEAWRAEQIARASAAFKSGEIEKAIWITAGDERVCPVCAPLDGHAIAATGNFQTAIGDIHGPPAHPRCRCWLWFQTRDGRIIGPAQRGGGDDDDGQQRVPAAA